MTRGASRRSPPILAALVLSAWSLASAPPARADALVDATSARRVAEALIRDDDCAQALPLLQQAAEADPGDARIPLLAAECQIRLLRYPEALDSLARVKRLDPTLPESDLYLGIAQYHMGDLEAARRALEAARTTSPGRAEVDLYLGMILLQQGQGRAAAGMLARAREAHPRVVEPVASYYEGLAWQSVGERGRADDALRRVLETAPGTAWAAAARRTLEDAPGWGPRRSFGEVQVGVEWDNNVALLGSDVVGGISGRRDLRTIWSGNLGTEVYRARDWAVGALVRYLGTAQTELYQFDIEYPGLAVWWDRMIGPRSTFRLQYELDYGWIGYEPFQFVQGVTPTLFHDWGERYGLTKVFAQAYLSDFFFRNFDIPDSIGPPGVDESQERNRDGWGVTVGIEHVVPWPLIEADIRGGFNYFHYDSVGREWRFNGYEAFLGIRKPLPFGVVFDGVASFTWRPFLHESTFPQNNTLPLVFTGAKRRDDAWQFEARLERPINDWLQVSARYYYLDNGSNTNVFNYRRQIWGGYVTLAWRQD